jgi:DNA-binding SARP family transcriptional activator
MSGGRRPRGTDGDAEIRLLGPVELSARGRALRLKGRLQRGLIAAFALHVNRTVPGRVLIDALWAEDPPATSEAQVRRQVSRLRRDLGEEMEIVTDPGGYRLRADPGRVDAVAFERRVADARRASEAGELDKAGSELAAALNLWRGPALSDLRGAYFEAEAALLEERHLMAQDEYAETRMAGGEHRDLIGELTARVSRHPMRERPRAQLMLALHRAGRQAEALETYRRGRDLLVAELGLEPSPELIRLHQAILTSDPGPHLASAAGLVPRPRPPRSDPRDSLIARLEEQVRRLKHQISNETPRSGG